MARNLGPHLHPCECSISEVAPTAPLKPLDDTAPAKTLMGTSRESLSWNHATKPHLEPCDIINAVHPIC